MGGAVAPIVKPITKVVDRVAGTDLSGGKAREQVAQANAKVAEMQTKAADVAEKATSSASKIEELQGSRLRGARRRGRQLLSDARLNPETGVQTLGSGQSL
jgi:hypothetical protein